MTIDGVPIPTRRDIFMGAAALISVPSPFGVRIFAYRVPKDVYVAEGMWITPDMWIVFFHEDGHYELWSDAQFKRLFEILGPLWTHSRVVEVRALAPKETIA
jgi:hypothetical protein